MNKIDVKDLTNQEIIDRINELWNEYCFLFIESITRYKNGEMSKDEYDKLVEVISNVMCKIVESLNIDRKSGEEGVKIAFDNVFKEDR